MIWNLGCSALRKCFLYTLSGMYLFTSAWLISRLSPGFDESIASVKVHGRGISGKDPTNWRGARSWSMARLALFSTHDKSVQKKRSTGKRFQAITELIGLRKVSRFQRRLVFFQYLPRLGLVEAAQTETTGVLLLLVHVLLAGDSRLLLFLERHGTT